MIKILKELLKINPYYYDSIYEYLKDVHESTKKIRKKKYMDNEQLKRIADAIEEILRIVKKDMEPRTKKN